MQKRGGELKGTPHSGTGRSAQGRERRPETFGSQRQRGDGPRLFPWCLRLVAVSANAAARAVSPSMSPTIAIAEDGNRSVTSGSVKPIITTALAKW